LSVIARTGIDNVELSAAVSRLPMPPAEPARFWTQIANDPKYSNHQRRVAVFELFRRHVYVGMKLSDLAMALNHPTWLTPNDINIIWFLHGGKLPVDVQNGIVYALPVLPMPGETDSIVDLVISGKTELDPQTFLPTPGQIESFRNLIFGKGASPAENATIEEIGFVEFGEMKRIAPKNGPDQGKD
jgi:hypothetical protein